LWRRNIAEATVAPELVQRLTRVGNGLRVLVVAEDWCPDSVHTREPHWIPIADAKSTAINVQRTVIMIAFRTGTFAVAPSS
jgi:hypothetical protein